MTSTAILNHPHMVRVISALSLPALVRLVSEIDDNGPISHRRGSLQSAFGDLTVNQLRYAIDVARELGLVHADPQAPTRYRLTEAGEDLAGVYDMAARWARTHQYPSPTSGFVTRVQHTLKLLTQPTAAVRDADRPHKPAVLATGHPGAETDADGALLPDAAKAALAEWLQTHPHILRSTAPRSSHAAQDLECAA
ncbi:hypothetical protein [Streptomyces sp. NBC_00582]|uniref:hypothetical protein n=1 Tax=Streptomyces sp. NBC_00582 TaxID=2975783 RepID=UPI002E81A560|nr:hypothetical protein [Streptomyces sp. NBC_00582]WUB60851.1 winged helix-turn-helix transcriptional regulator [Streptomyces sp. NBC_00582]